MLAQSPSSPLSPSLSVTAISDRLKDRNVSIRLSDAGLEHVIAKAYLPEYGARPIRRYLEKHITTEVSRLLISGKLDHDQVLDIGASLPPGSKDWEDSTLTFDISPAPPKSGRASANGNGVSSMDVDEEDLSAPPLFRPSPGRGTI
jgi:hypothetical protein